MKHVIACIDESRMAHAVTQYATWSAQRLQTPLTLFHVLDELRYPVNSDMTGNIGLGSRESLLEELAELDERRNKLALEHGHHLLEAAKTHAKELGAKDVHLRQRHGDLAESLGTLEDELRLLVIGLHGTKTCDSDRLGHQIETIVRNVRRPILAVPEQYKAPTNVMLAFDGSDVSRKGVKMLAESPLFVGMPIHVVMVGAATADANASVEAAVSHLQEYRHQVSYEIRAGEVESTLRDIQQERNIDMLIMGAYSHSKLRQLFMGSTTSKVLSRAKTPVLLLR